MCLYLYEAHTWNLHNMEEIAKGSQRAVGTTRGFKALS